MELILWLMILLCIIVGFYSAIKLKDVINPVTLSMIFFVFPLGMNRFKLSGLQPDKWRDDTYLVIIFYLIVFIILPTLYFLYKPMPKKNPKIIFTNHSMIQSLLFFIIGITSQMILNFLNTSFYLPILHMVELQLLGIKYHVIKIGFWGIFFTTIWIFNTVLIFIQYSQSKSKILLILCILCLLSPLSRLARLDILYALSIIFFIAINNSNNIKRTIISIICIVSLSVLLLGGGISLFRWSVGGLYETSISKEIDFTLNDDPLEAFSFLYAYFPLNFDNIDRFINSMDYSFQYSLGSYMLQPILVGVFKVHRLIDGYPYIEYFNSFRDPLSPVSTVSTAIPGFLLDYGIYFSFIPMLLYSILGMLLYLNGYKNANLRLIYMLFAPCYVLSAFQNLFIQPRFLYLVILLFIYQIIVSTKIYLHKS